MNRQAMSFQNQSIAATLLRVFSDVNAGKRQRAFKVAWLNLSREVILAIWLAIALLSGLWLLWFTWPTGRTTLLREHFEYGLFLLAMIWYSVHVMTYYLTLLMLPVALVAGRLTASVLDRSADGLDKKLWVCWVVYLLAYVSVISQYWRAMGSYQWAVAAIAAGLMLLARQAIRIAGR